MGRGRGEQPIEEADIRDATTDGRGVAGVDGKAVFVDAALTGERVRFQRIRHRKNYDEAVLIEVLTASPERVTPVCTYFGVCGACTLQHLSGPGQLAVKQNSLLQSLQRIGKVAPTEELAPLAGAPTGYRRRARVGARHIEKKARVLVGFREKHKPYVADMASCETLVPKLAQLIVPLSELIGSLSIYQHIPQIEMSAADNAVALVMRVLEPPSAADCDAFAAFQTQHSVQLWLQSGGPATVVPLSGSAHAELYYDLPEFDLRLSYGPLDFVQVNQDMNQRMLHQAIGLLQPLPGERVLDLFCGIGNFSLPLARSGAQVTGVELDDVMVAKAIRNAAANGLDNVNFVTGDLMQPDQDQSFWQQSFDTVVLDPPRAGAREVLERIAATGAKRILYVSCHAGSLARDAGILVAEHGYRLQNAGAMDMFPQTSHVEAMALFVLGDA